MKLKVSSPSFCKNDFLVKELKKYFSNITLNDTGKYFKDEELLKFIKDSEALIIGTDKISDEILSECKNLKFISKYGVGLDNIDLEACKKRDVSIGWSGGVNRLSVAELTLGCMLMLCRNLYTSSNDLKNLYWNKNGGFNLSSKTIGIIGCGFIGKELVRLLKPFSCKILVNDIKEQRDYYKKEGLILSSKEDIYKNSDIISLHIPLDESTDNLISEKEFLLMKKTSYLINTSRGGIVNEKALKEALKSFIIAGAAIDVYETEPPFDKELLSIPNLITTPHIGGNSKESVEAMGLSAIKHLREYFSL